MILPLTYIVWGILLLVLGIGAYRFPMLDNGSRIMYGSVVVGFLSEAFGLFSALKYHTNELVYNIYDVVNFAVLCLYFNATIENMSRKRLGIYLGALGMIAGFTNLVIMHKSGHDNTYFLLFAGFCVSGLSLFSFYKLLLNSEQFQITKYPHFWFTALLLFYWNISLINWGTYRLLCDKFPSITDGLNIFNYVVNMFVYAVLGVIFLLYPKLKTQSER